MKKLAQLNILKDKINCKSFGVNNITGTLVFKNPVELTESTRNGMDSCLFKHEFLLSLL